MRIFLNGMTKICSDLNMFVDSFERKIGNHLRLLNTLKPHLLNDILFVFLDSPDVIFSDHTKKGRKMYKDSEKVPLGESDELAMI